jgi:hypothetical protein
LWTARQFADIMSACGDEILLRGISGLPWDYMIACGDEFLRPAKVKRRKFLFCSYRLRRWMSCAEMDRAAESLRAIQFQNAVQESVHPENLSSPVAC